MLESLRTQLPKFDLRSVLAEVSDWFQPGISCFGRILQTRKLPARDHSPLDDLVPLVNST